MRGKTFNLRELLHSYAIRKVWRKIPTSAPRSDVTWICRNVFKQTRMALRSGHCSPRFACTEAPAVATPHRFTEEETKRGQVDRLPGGGRLQNWDSTLASGSRVWLINTALHAGSRGPQTP